MPLLGKSCYLPRVDMALKIEFTYFVKTNIFCIESEQLICK